MSSIQQLEENLSYIMNGTLKNGVSKIQDACLVLQNNLTAQDVGKAMIEGGQQKQPFYIFDNDQAYLRIQYFKKKMPRINIFFAMKANDSSHMIKMAIAMGLGFDCASPGEIAKLRMLGVNPQSIIFALASKTTYQMTFARDCGVKHTTFDSLYELQKIKMYWPDARLLIRIRVDSNSTYKLGDKFGCDFESEAKYLLDEAARLNLNVIGVAFHVGSPCFSKESYVTALTNARELFDHEERAGRKMSIVDIGGGFLSERIDQIDEVSNLINDNLDKLFSDPEIQVIAEPGRYLCDSTLTLYCSISNIRTTIKGSKTVKMIYLNDGIYGTLRCPEPWHTITIFKNSSSKLKKEEEYDTILWGPSCDSTDKVDVNARLTECDPDDWLVFSMQGAYTHGFSSRFSLLELPSTRAVISKEIWKIIKDHPIYGSEDFVEDSCICSPLPSTLPNVIAPVDSYSNKYNSFTLLS